jgi:hypothetical protein
MSVRFDSPKLMAAAAAFALFLIPVHAAPQQNAAADANVNPAAAKPTPHLKNGHPDLNGTWNPWVGHVIRDDDQAKKGAGKTLQDGSIVATYSYERRYNAGGGGGRGRGGAGAPSKPEYKPELAAKVKDLEDHQNRTDPSFKCLAPGVPRIGPPHEIVQSDKKVVFVYSDLAGNFWRIIPTDGRPHNADADPSYLGDSVGHWEGDTLVVDDLNFTDDTWMGPGYFHSSAEHVTERLTRHGDSLVYEVTVEDPNVLTKPWTLQPRTMNLSDTPLEEAPPCKDMDQPHFVTNDHEGGF